MSSEATTQVAAIERRSGTVLRENIGRVLCIVVPLIVWFAPLSIPDATKHGLSISSFMILAWMTEALDYAVRRTGGGYMTPTGTKFSGSSAKKPNTPVRS